MTDSLDYRSSGVDIDEGERAVARMKSLARATFTPRVMSDLGGFGGLFRADFGGLREPVLVASTDGVGTKLRVASMTGRYDTVGRDLVNHCVNDILAQGAEPLFFLDYIACGRLEASVAVRIVEGLSAACIENGCALLGGETAEMPGFYAPGDYDVAGTIVGVADRDSIPDRSLVEPGMPVLGLHSSGLHTNGYSLARRVLFDKAGLSPDDRPDELGGVTVADALLEVHLSYLKAVGPMLRGGLAAGICHVTGGGIPGNLPRILPEGCGALIRLPDDPPPLFGLIRDLGEISDHEMQRAFNLGAGMLVVLRRGLEEAAGMAREAGFRAYEAGSIDSTGRITLD